MNPVPRPMVYTAALALAGVCVLGLYLGLQPALERSADLEQSLAASNAPAMKPGMTAAAEAIPLKTETPPPSAAPAQLADAKPKTKPSAQDTAPSSDDDADDNGLSSSGKAAPPEPPTLYAPDEPPAPPPAGASAGANTPPY
ncbi:MAG TPA: hypothetical protein VIJ94_14210 [Caulobacteraceae bacterium]